MISMHAAPITIKTHGEVMRHIMNKIIALIISHIMLDLPIVIQ